MAKYIKIAELSEKASKNEIPVSLDNSLDYQELYKILSEEQEQIENYLSNPSSYTEKNKRIKISDLCSLVSSKKIKTCNEYESYYQDWYKSLKEEEQLINSYLSKPDEFVIKNKSGE